MSEEITGAVAGSLPIRSVILAVDHDTSYDDEHPGQPGVLTTRGWRFGDHHWVDSLDQDSTWLVLRRGPERPGLFLIEVTWQQLPEPNFLIEIPQISARMQLADDSPVVGPEFRKAIRSQGRHMLASRLGLDPTDCPSSQMHYSSVAENRLRGQVGP